MILLDSGGTIFSAIHVALQKERTNTCSEDFLRHLIINQMRSINLKFREEYGQLIICSDASGNWRKKKYPFYKANRVYKVKADGPNWTDIFQKLNKVMLEIRDNLPFKYIQVYGCEADDIIGCLVHKRKQLIPEEENILIVSSDKDMAQLLRDKKVKQYKPHTKVMAREDNPEKFLLELIMRGDRSDGVPNIRSENDSFITGTRQKQIPAMFVEQVWRTKGACLNDFEKQRFKENTDLIDLGSTPKNLVNEILQEFQKPINNINSSKTLSYLASCGLVTLCEKLDDFKRG